LRPKIVPVLIVAWLLLLWSLFLFFQYRNLLRENHAFEYLAAFASVVLILLAATGMGSMLLGRRPESLRVILAACAVGLALFGVATFALGSVSLLNPYVIWTILAGIVVATRRSLGMMLKRLVGIALPDIGGAMGAAFLALIIVAAVTSLISCLAPLTANDALVYHLNLPKIYAGESALVHLPNNVYANMPHYGEVLYTMFFSVAGETGAKIFYCFMLLGAASAVYSMAARFVPRRFALVGASFFLIQPLVLDPRIICNVDVMLAYFYLAAVILMLDLSDRGKVSEIRHLFGASALAGFMMGIKYTALVPAASLLVVPLLAASRPSWKRAALGALVALAVFSPWAVKNEAYVGNPVYPMMEGVFDGENWDQVQSEQLISWQTSMGMGRNAGDYLLLPVNLSTRGKPGLNYARFDGTLSPVMLVLLPLALIRRKRESTALIIMAAAGFVFWALSSQQLRFLIPSLALAAVLAGTGLGNLAKLIGRRMLWVTLLMLLLIEASSLAVPDQYGRPFLSQAYGDRLAVVTGLEPRRSFLERSIQSYSLFDQINRNSPAGEPVFLIWENRGYYLDRPYFADSFFEASAVMRMVADSAGPEALKARISSMGYRYVVVNELLGDFFSRPYPPRSAALLGEFTAKHLEPIESANRLTLYRIAD
jgi:hypothetical protein